MTQKDRRTGRTRAPGKPARRHKKEWIKLVSITVAAALCCGVFLVSILQIADILLERKVAADEYDDLRNTYAPDAQSSMSSAGGNQPPPEPWEVNPDYAGWLAVPGAGIDYPVVRGFDNARYLNTTFEGNRNASGAIFMDCGNVQGFASFHTILYGHNMKDGSMFGNLKKYLDATYLAQNASIAVTLSDKTTAHYTIFASRVATATDAAYRLDFVDGADFATFAAELGAPEGTTRLLTLSTCTNGEDDTERILVHAALAN